MKLAARLSAALRILGACNLLFTLSGCLGATGAAIVGIVGSDSDSGSTNVIAPLQIRAADLAGTAIPLPATPVGVAIGDFIPADGNTLQDVAVVTTRQEVIVYRGDGTGQLTRHTTVPLSSLASTPQAVETVRQNGRGDVILVATVQSLEVIGWNDAKGRLEAREPLELVFDPDQRDLVVGHFDGDTVLDAAVSSRFIGVVELFKGEDDGEFQLRPWTQLPISVPRAMASANFDGDPNGLSDLAILTSDNNQPTLLLLLSQGDGRFTEKSRTVENDATINFGASLDARNDAVLEPVGGVGLGKDDPDHEDPYPDVVMARRRNVARVFVRQGDVGPGLEKHPRPTGPPVSRPAAVKLIQLPRSEPNGKLWDIIVADNAEKGVVVGYTENNVSNQSNLLYPVPGDPVGLAVGDLSGDGLDDIAVVTVNPDGLTLLLTNPPAPGVEKKPFYYPRGALIGEDLPLTSRVDMVDFGFAGVGNTQQFLAADRASAKQVAIVRLDPITGKPLADVETHSFVSTTQEVEQIEGLAVGDFDTDGRDDVIAVTEDGKVFLLLGRGSDRFQPWSTGVEEGLVLELAVVPERPDDLLTELIDLRRPTVVDVDGDGSSDILLPASKKVADNDYVVVILNVGSGLPKVFFYKAMKAPKYIDVSRIDADEALDLVISVEDSNKLLILFGDPDRPGEFFRLPGEGPTPPGYKAPLVLDGFDEEMEFSITDSRARDFDAPANYLIAAGKTKVAVYYRTADEESPFGPPCVIFTGSDPETLILRDICEDGTLELAIGDEDAGKIHLFRDTGTIEAGACHSWVPVGVLPVEGRPDQFLFYETGDDQLVLASTTKLTRIEFFTKPLLDMSCAFPGHSEIELRVPNFPGNRLGLSVFSLPSGETMVASNVEDGEVVTGFAAIDVLFFPPGAADEEVYSFGGNRSAVPRTRLVSIPEPGAPLTDQEEVFDGLLLGQFSGSDVAPDLLLHEAETGGVFLLPGQSTSGAAGGGEDVPGEWNPFAPDKQRLFTLEGPLVALARAELSPAEHVAVIATESDVYLFDPRPQSATKRLTRVETGGAGKIEDVALGWAGAANRQLSDLLIVTLRDGELLAQSALQQNARSVTSEVAGVFGCGDFSGDGMDDIVISTEEELRLFVALPNGDFDEGEPVVWERAIHPHELVVLDANGDAHLDAAVATPRGDVFVIPGDGTGKLVQDALSQVFVGPELEALRVADLDGDATDEMITSERVPGLSILQSSRRE